MLLSNNTKDAKTLSMSISDKKIDELLEKEWLLANSRGGYCCSTVTGCNTRRYHSLLTGSMNPPASRIVALSSVFESVTVNSKEFILSEFEFAQQEPSTPGLLRNFYKDIGAHFEYQLGSIEITKSVYIMPDTDAVALVYDFEDVYEEIQFNVRPLVAMRDFHALRRSDRSFSTELLGEGIIISACNEDTGKLFMKTENMYFNDDQQWWYNFMYRKESQRGQDCVEDLFSPGAFKCKIEGPTRIVLWASFGNDNNIEDSVDVDLDIMLDNLCLHQKELSRPAKKTKDETFEMLCSAADQFVVERQINSQPASTILAGFPWFLDWGRDTFISLPGLLLETERYEQAASVLTTFAGAVSKGMIPNRFDDYNNTPHYNSIDASLWFVHAAFEYVRKSGDEKTFDEKLLPAIAEIIKSYHDGTRDNIHAEPDGLISGGDPDTQLTWMDAKCGGIAFTPRYGKAVEINALWYNSLCSMAEYLSKQPIDKYDFVGDMNLYKKMAKKVRISFCSAFWNRETGYLNDCILPDGTIDSSLRPNQVYAIALPFSPLPIEMKKSILEAVGEKLLTPFGLRTLSPDDARYCPIYIGEQMNRDRAYHQGTVWPHLIGPFIEAWLRTNSFSKTSKAQANSFISPLLNHLKNDACLGSVSEIFDAEPPHKARGCFAQAWGVAEVLRSYRMINRPGN